MRRSTGRVYVRRARLPGASGSQRGDHRPTVVHVAAAIPLFPLSHVLLPGMPLPLHVFEERYRRLLADITAPDRLGAFGVVALRRGTEAVTPGTAQAGSEVEEIGTLAEILEVETKPDGTSDVLSVGSRRFRVLRLLPETAGYLRADVEFLDEPDGPVTADQAVRAAELMGVYDSMLLRLAGRGTGSDMPEDANQLSYQLAARLPLPPGERQRLLADATTAQRLERLSRLLRREIALLQRTRSIAVSPAVVRMPAGSN
jgi:Lon protease-like protein